MNKVIETNKISKIINKTSKAIESQAKKKYELSEKLIKEENIELNELKTAVRNHYLFSEHTKKVCEKLLTLVNTKNSDTIHTLQTIINRLTIINKNLKMQTAALENNNTEGYLLLFSREKEVNKTTINNYSKKLGKFNIVIPRKTIMIATLIILSIIGQINQTVAKGNLEENKTELSSKIVSLNKGEHIVPDNVMESFALANNEASTLYAAPNGVTISNKYLDINDRKKIFITQLEKNNYSKTQINDYINLFNTQGNIIIKQSIAGTKKGNITLRHERIHKLLKTIRSSGRQQLQKIAEEMLGLMNEGYVPSNSAKFQIAYAGMRAAERNWEEFYTYFIQGDFDERIDKILNERYPTVYKFIINLTKQAGHNLEF